MDLHFKQIPINFPEHCCLLFSCLVDYSTATNLDEMDDVIDDSI